MLLKLFSLKRLEQYNLIICILFIYMNYEMTLTLLTHAIFTNVIRSFEHVRHSKLLPITC